MLKVSVRKMTALTEKMETVTLTLMFVGACIIVITEE